MSGKTRSLTILNETGDKTIVWSDEDDDEMEAIIEKKMVAGITFYIIEPRAWGLLPPKKTELKEFDEVRKHRALAIKDADFARFVSDGHGDVVPTPATPANTVRRGKNAKEVAQAESVGVKQKRGG